MEIDLNHDGEIDMEEYLQIQSKRWLYRRIITFITLAFYIAVTGVLILLVQPEHVDVYTGLYVQVSLFCGAILMAYFGGSSYEEVKLDKEKIVSEFQKVQEVTQTLRRK
nr:hypothetical protein ORM20_00023 [Ochrobactrum phage ORM_20]